MNYRLPTFLKNPEAVFILMFIGLTLISSIFLASVERHQNQLSSEKNIWMLSFQEPKSDSLDFRVGNYTKQTDFHWSAGFGDGQLISEGNVTITPGTEQDVRVDTKTAPGKIIITVTAGDEQKQIYKIF